MLGNLLPFVARADAIDDRLRRVGRRNDHELGGAIAEAKVRVLGRQSRERGTARCIAQL